MADVPVPSDAFPAIHPETGELVEIPGSAVQQAIRDGFTAPTPEQSLHWAQQRHYGGGWESAKAFAEGVGEGVLGPVIPGMEVASGVDPEAIRGRKEANPALNTTGQVVGFVAPAIATLGTSAPASGAGAAAKATLPGLLSAAGEVAAKGTAKVVGEGALGRIATSGARLATEGALLGASNVATKAIIQDPNAPLTMEKAAAEIGFSALAGGVLGAGGRTLREAIPAGVTDKLQAWLGETAGNRANKAAGAIQGDLVRAEKRMSREQLNAIGQRAVDNGWVSPLSTPASTFEKTSEAMAQAGDGMGALLEKASSGGREPLKMIGDDAAEFATRNGPLRLEFSIKGQTPTVEAIAADGRKVGLAEFVGEGAGEGTLKGGHVRVADDMRRQGIASAMYDLAASRTGKKIVPSGYQSELGEKFVAGYRGPTFDWDNIRKEINEKALDPLRQKASTLPAVKQAETVLENFSQVYGERPLSVSDLHGMRRDLDAIIYQHGRAADPFAKAVAEPLSDARAVLSGDIEKGIEAAGMDTAEWKALNAAYRDAKTVNGFALKGMQRAEGNNALSLTESMGALTGVATHGLSGGVLGAVGTAALRRHSAGTIAWAATAAQKALLRMAEGGESKIAAGLGRLFEAGGAKAGAEAAERVLTPTNYRGIADNLRQSSGDLDRLASATSAQTSELKQHAPEHGAAADGIVARGTSYLASKLPPETTPGPFGGPYRPSAAELDAFNRAARIAERPTSILDDIAHGTIHPEHVEALSAIYPALHQEMTQQIIEGLANLTAQGGTIPFKVRMGLALFLGGNMDPALSSASMQANQATFAVAAQNEQTGNVEPSSRGAENLGVARRMATPMQASAARNG